MRAVWPDHLQYIPTSIAKDIHPCILDSLLKTDDVSECMLLTKQAVHPFVEVRKITNHLKEHPLYAIKTLSGHDNYGVFSLETIPEGEPIGEYAAQISVHSKIETSEYVWHSCYHKAAFFIDARSFANEMALVNHYQGLSDKPNVKLKQVPHLGKIYFMYVSISSIAKGEEILTDYGSSFGKVLQEKREANRVSIAPVGT